MEATREQDYNLDSIAESDFRIASDGTWFYHGSPILRKSLVKLFATVLKREKDGSFWLTCTRRRKRVAALEQRPRASIAVSSRGTDIGMSQAVTYRGDIKIFDDQVTSDWFYRALAEKVRPGTKSQQDAFVEHLDTPGRVVIELIPDPDGRIGFDSEQMFANSPAGRSSHNS